MAKVFLSPATMVGASVAGALLLAAYLVSIATREQAPEPLPERRAAAAAPALQAQPARATAPSEPQPVRAQPVAMASTCPTQAQTAARDAADGRFTLEGALSSGSGIDPAAFVAVAREAAQQGRARDAETALLAACHVAERRSGAQSPMVVDLKSRIASLHDPVKLQVAPGTIERTPTSTMGAAREYAEPAPATLRGPAARLIREDPELAQLEHDMERLRAQASRVSRDPRGLSARDSQALARRESGCQDKACLLRWYAQRRSQLLAEFR